MQKGQRIAFLAIAVVIVVVGFVIAKGSGGDDGATKTTTTTQAAPQATTGQPTTTATAPAAPAVPTIVITGGKPAGGVQDIKVNKGDQVRFKVRSDVADEIHVHGYDFHKDVAAGGSASFSFPASIDGKFDVELEGRGEQIASLVVEP